MRMEDVKDSMNEFLLTMKSNRGRADSESAIVHLGECDLVDESCHFALDDDEVWDYRSSGVLEANYASNSETPSPILESVACAIPLDTPYAAGSCDSFFETETSPVGNTRPEFLFARSFKDAKNVSSGLHLVDRRKGVYISRIAPDSIFAKSNLRLGDRVLSVNGVSCSNSSARRVAQLIKAAESDVSIAVHNAGGNSNLLSSSVQKPSKMCMVGLGFRNRLGALQISRVDEDGLFGGSLLVHGHRCLMINGTPSPNTPSKEAARMVRDSREFVTIVSKPDATSAVVIGASDRGNGLLKRVSTCFGTSTNASAVPY